ncbi:hypothetical protein C8J56DRAFT_1160680 [Mycena floridula]|nr:hypothetical protein C8J56DRAFT_1160680 [Mycena floridula]
MISIDDLPDDVLLHIFKHGCGMDPDESRGDDFTTESSGPFMNPFAKLARETCKRWKGLVGLEAHSCDFWYSNLRLDFSWRYAEAVESVEAFQRHLSTVPTNELHVVLILTTRTERELPFDHKSQMMRPDSPEYQHLKGTEDIDMKLFLEATMLLLPHAHRIRMLHISACDDILTRFIFPFLSLLQPMARRLEFLHINSLRLVDDEGEPYTLSSATFDIQPSKEGFSLPQLLDVFDFAALKSLTQLELWDIDMIPLSFTSTTLQNVLLRSMPIEWSCLIQLLRSCPLLQVMWLEASVEKIPDDPRVSMVSISYISTLEVRMTPVDKLAAALFTVFQFPRLESVYLDHFDMAMADNFLSQIQPLPATTTLTLRYFNFRTTSFMQALHLPSLQTLKIRDIYPSCFVADQSVMEFQPVSVAPPSLLIKYHSYRFLSLALSAHTFEHLLTLELFRAFPFVATSPSSPKVFTPSLSLQMPRLERVILREKQSVTLFLTTGMFYAPNLQCLELYGDTDQVSIPKLANTEKLHQIKKLIIAPTALDQEIILKRLPNVEHLVVTSVPYPLDRLHAWLNQGNMELAFPSLSRLSIYCPVQYYQAEVMEDLKQIGELRKVPFVFDFVEKL